MILGQSGQKNLGDSSQQKKVGTTACTCHPSNFGKLKVGGL
jgi:hypothetical protein